jgi:tRNA pseudouridine55 synthase
MDSRNNSVILVDKPVGITSFGVVNQIRKFLSNQYGGKIKVGHTGTLDPFASGLMIILTGSECKNADHYSKLDKVYRSTIRLGEVSTTGDTEGQISDISNMVPTLTEIETVLDKFRGEIIQRPPIYSAIKINGQRAYKIARAGKTVEMPERQVVVYDLQLEDYNYPILKIKVHVSSGTYIRSLATDIGQALNVGAYCVELRRTEISKWTVDQAQKLSMF